MVLIVTSKCCLSETSFVNISILVIVFVGGGKISHLTFVWQECNVDFLQCFYFSCRCRFAQIVEQLLWTHCMRIFQFGWCFWLVMCKYLVGQQVLQMNGKTREMIFNVISIVEYWIEHHLVSLIIIKYKLLRKKSQRKMKSQPVLTLVKHKKSQMGVVNVGDGPWIYCGLIAFILTFTTNQFANLWKM